MISHTEKDWFWYAQIVGQGRLNLLNLRGLTDGDVEGVIGTLDPAGIAHVEGALASLSRQEAPMPRRKSLVTVIRDMVREQVREAVQGLLGAVGGPKKKVANGRRRRRRVWSGVRALALFLASQTCGAAW